MKRKKGEKNIFATIIKIIILYLFKKFLYLFLKFPLYYTKLFLFNFLLGLLLKGLWGLLIAMGVDASKASKEYRFVADIMKLGPKIG